MYGSLQGATGLQPIHRKRLEAEEVKNERLKRLRRSVRQRILAEDDVHHKQEVEFAIIRYAAQRGLTHASLDPQTALALARASSAAIEAEETAANLKVKECILKLETLQDKADDLRARRDEAELQIGSVLQAIKAHKLPVDIRMTDLSEYACPPLLPKTRLNKNALSDRESLAATASTNHASDPGSSRLSYDTGSSPK